MSRIKPFKVYRKRRDYFFLKSVLIIAAIICVFCLYSYNSNTELPFFASRFTRWVTLLMLGILAVFFTIKSFTLFTKDDETLDNKYRYNRLKKTSSILAMYLFAIVVTIYFGGLFLWFTEGAVQGLFSLYTTYLGNPKVQSATLKADVIANPSFGSVINAGTTKYPRDIIDPSTYKIYGVIHINGQYYRLPAHCYTGKEPIKIKSEVFAIIGRKSFAGFICTEKCALSYQFTNTTNAAVPANQLMECHALNRTQPDAPES